MNASLIERIRKRFGDHRPGLQLVGVVDAAVPVTVLRVDVLAQERKELPLLEEFILRFVREGVRDLNELASLLGLQRSQVVKSVAEQISANNLIRRSDGRLELTALGLESARNLAAVQPVLSQLNVPFDRLVWNVQDYPRASLIKKRGAQDAGLELLPAKKTARVDLNDLTVERFNELIESSEARMRQVEVLRVRKIAAQNLHLYVPAQLLIYGDPDSGDVELGLCIDGVLQPAHGLELAAVDAVKQLGISVVNAEPRPILSRELEEQRVPKEDIEAIGVVSDAPSAGANSSAPNRRLEDIQVRSVDVHEHRALLSQAITSSKRRVLILSPSVRAGVVNTDFVASLERRLRQGVEIYIGYSCGPDGGGSDEWALNRLKDLSVRFGKLHIVPLENVNAKTLIFDDTWISTSFSWLSFKGDPSRTYRLDEGTLVQIPSEVDRAFAKYVSVLESGDGDSDESGLRVQ